MIDVVEFMKERLLSRSNQWSFRPVFERTPGRSREFATFAPHVRQFQMRLRSPESFEFAVVLQSGFARIRDAMRLLRCLRG